MVALNVVRRIDVIASSTGVPETTAKLEALSRAQATVGTTADGMAAKTDAVARRQVALVGSYDRLIQQQNAFARSQTDVNRSFQQAVSANDNVAKSFTVAGLEAAEMANHLRTVGTAAYAFSPAFREVVNSMAAPALRGAGVALVAVAGGLVTATNLAGTGLVRLGASSALASASLTPVAGAITSAGVAMQAFNPSLTGVASTILGRLLPALRLLGSVGVVVNAAGLIADAWRLGGEELERYRGIAESAAKVGLSTAYFQKLIKGAEDAKVPVDALTTALTNLQKSSADQLGGSALESRLAASVKAGNFGGNSGVQDFAQANTTQQRFEAIVSLINQAMTAGQRLAALDIAGTAFGPEVVENLRKDSEYLDKIKAAADKVAEKTLVSPEDIGRAVELQSRYDAAVKLLETRWHPVQNLLTQAGIEFQANWVATVETIAQGFDWAAKLVAKLGDVPAWFSKKINEGSQWVIDNTTTPESRKAAEVSGNISSDPVEMAKGTDAYSIAVSKLRAGLQDQAEQQRKVSEANTIAQKTLGDTSKVIEGQKKATSGSADAYDRALESITKHTARTEADAKAVGLGAGTLEEYRARTQLTTAAQLAGREMTAGLTAEIEKQAKAAGAAALELAKLKIADDIKFDRATIGLSAEDAQIAQQLRKIYPDVASSINSSEAAQIRFNNSLRSMADAQRDAFGDFLQNMRSGKSVMDSLTSALGGFADKMAKIGGDKLFDGLKSGNLFSGITAANDNSKQGIVEGFEAIQKQAALAKQNTFQFNGGTAMAGVAAVGAGVGIYGQAKQQAAAGASTGATIASSALTGAMAGAAIAGPVGAAVGAVGGAIMGWFGADSGAKQAAAKAQDDWNAVKVQAADFARVLATGGAGSLTSAFAQARSQTISFADTARKAGNSAEADHLWDSYTMYVMRTAEAFRRSFGGIVDALNSGLGTNSPFASAAANVKSVGDELKGFVDDVRISFANDPVANTAGNASGGGDSQIAEARRAAQSYLLSLLGQAPVLSEVATAISHLQGTATQLQSTLVELGMSSENAARAISEGVGKAMDALREKFDQGLTARLNTASGQGYLNDTAVLIEQFKQDSADAAMLGLDQARVAAVFRAEAQKIVDDAGLVGDSFISFATQFPELTNVVNQSTTAMQAAADAQKKILDEQVSFVQGIAKTITAYLQGLKTGASSILNPQDQLAASKSAFASQSALAQSGNRDALSGITQVAQTYLDQAKSFYASSAGYTAAYNEVTSVLQGLATVSPATVASADAQAIIAAVNSTTGAVTSTAAQSDALVTAQTTLIAASNTLASSQVSLANSQVSILGEIRSLNSTSSQQLDLLNQQYASHPFNADAGGGSRTFDYSLREALNKIVYNTWATASNTAGGNHYVGVYARGGLITGSGTGTSDDVPIRASNGEYMITASTVDRLGVSFFDQINAGRTPAVPAAMPAFRAPNDNARGPGNGQDISTLGNTLVRAITGAAMAEITSNKEEMAGLKAEIARLSRAIEGGKPKAPQAGTRMAS